MTVPALLLCLVLASPAVAVHMGSATAMSPRDVYMGAVPSVVSLEMVGESGKVTRGTGFFVEPRVIATNAHLVRGMASGEAAFHSGVTARLGRVLLTDPAADLALVAVDGPPGPPLALGTEERLRIGDRIYVIGNPKGLAGTLSEGLVSSMRGAGRTSMLQLSTPISPGSSGSPVLDEQGHVVGVIRGRVPGGNSLTFAAPVSRLAALDAMSTAAAKALSAIEPGGLPPVPGFEAALPADLGLPTEEIVIGVPHWDTVEVTAHILKALIEQRFPYHVRLARSTTEEAFMKMSAPGGGIDIHPEIWLPNHEKLWEGHIAGRMSVVTNKKPYVGFQQLCVPGYVHDRHGVESVADLRRPGVAKLFDSDGDGAGELWLGQEGWHSTQIQRAHARDMGYAPLFDLRTGEESGAWERLERRIKAKRPILTYCYAPHWTTRVFDLHALKMPPHRPDCYAIADPSEAGALQRSRAACQGPPPKIYVAFSTRLFRKAPPVAKLLSNLELNAEIVSDWSRAIKRDGAEPRTFSREWVKHFSTQLIGARQ